MFIPDYNNTPNLPPKSPVDEFPFSRWYCFVVEVEVGMVDRRNVCGCRIWILFLNIWMAGSKEPYVFEIQL